MGLLNKDDGIIKRVIVAGLGGALATALGAGVVGVATALGWTPPAFVAWLKSMARFWTAEDTLPRWEFWLLWAVVAFLVAFLMLTYYAWRWPNTPQYRYHGDVLEGIKWRWTITAQNDVASLRMFCPECDRRFHEAEFGFATATASGPQFSIVCKTKDCGYATAVPSLHQLYAEVKAEAERKIRNGQWKRSKVT